MNKDTTDTQSSASGGYISFVAHLWVADNGKLIRGTIEDVHTGKQLALDLSEVIAFLQASLAHSPEQALDMQDEGGEGTMSERLSVDGPQDNHSQSPQNGDEISGY